VIANLDELSSREKEELKNLFPSELPAASASGAAADEEGDSQSELGKRKRSDSPPKSTDSKLPTTSASSSTSSVSSSSSASSSSSGGGASSALEELKSRQKRQSASVSAARVQDSHKDKEESETGRHLYRPSVRKAQAAAAEAQNEDPAERARKRLKADKKKAMLSFDEEA
jgi:hypothetical protein